MGEGRWHLALFDMAPLISLMKLRSWRLLSTWGQVFCLNRNNSLLGSEGKSARLIGHIPYKIDRQVTHGKPHSAKCTSTMPLFLNCWQVLAHFVVWRPIRGHCQMEPAVGDWPIVQNCCPMPSIAQPSAGGPVAEGVALQPEG